MRWCTTSTPGSFSSSVVNSQSGWGGAPGGVGFRVLLLLRTSRFPDLSYSRFLVRVRCGSSHLPAPQTTLRAALHASVAPRTGSAQTAQHVFFGVPLPLPRPPPCGRTRVAPHCLPANGGRAARAPLRAPS